MPTHKEYLVFLLSSGSNWATTKAQNDVSELDRLASIGWRVLINLHQNEPPALLLERDRRTL